MYSLIRHITFIITLIIFLLPDKLYSVYIFKPQDFGLQINLGHINKSKMTKLQKDTIVFGLFNLEDLSEDIAIYYRSRGKIIIFRNCGNGNAEEWRTIEANGKKIINIKAVPPDNYFLNPYQRYSIEINYLDGTKEKIGNKKILNPDYVESKSPIRDFFYEPKAFIYNITFIEQWRSERNYQPVYHTEVGDIDRDGKNEAVYTFYPEGGSYYPTHLVIFECINQNQYRIDWDSVYNFGGFYNLGFPLTDFDKDGNKEFFSMGRDPAQQREIGLFECYGEGVYKYMHTNLTRQSLPMEINLLDSVIIGDTTSPGFWILYSNYAENYYTEFQKYQIKKKYSSVFEFRPFIPDCLQGNNYFVYSITASDIDKDGKEEIVEGDTQWGTGYIGYWDSTGAATHKGYTYKVIYPAAPISGGYLIGKDLDGDKYKEITACGIGIGTGSIGIVKHTGNPGENTFNVMWWDSAGIEAMPNMGIDTGSIDGKYSILFPTQISIPGPFNPLPQLHLLTYSQNSIYNFFQSCHIIKDSIAFIGAKLFDIDKDNKINIIASTGLENNPPETYFHLMDWEQFGTIGINNQFSNIVENYKLYQNYPNPFNPTTKILYNLQKSGFVNITIYNTSGQVIKILTNEYRNAGSYIVEFDGSNLSSGIYFYKITSGTYSEVKKMILIK